MVIFLFIIAFGDPSKAGRELVYINILLTVVFFIILNLLFRFLNLYLALNIRNNTFVLASLLSLYLINYSFICGFLFWQKLKRLSLSERPYVHLTIKRGENIF